MNSDLSTFLARHTAFDEAAANWNNGTLPLRIVSYQSAVVPPSEYITSVRAIVFRDADMLVLCNRDSTHIMPGGRREAGESFEQTLRRELLEEAGWTLAQIEVLGFRHFQHLAPKPPAYLYPYPDFVWLICMAAAAEYQPIGRAHDEYEEAASLQPIEQVKTLDLTRAEHMFLDIALQRRKRSV